MGERLRAYDHHGFDPNFSIQGIEANDSSGGMFDDSVKKPGMVGTQYKQA